MRAGSHRPQRGATYVWLLAAGTIAGLALAKVGMAWEETAQRVREEELLRVGQAYAQAIDRYRRWSPGYRKDFPPDLPSLLEDRRFLVPVRHLRELYSDPLDPQRPWLLVRAPVLR